MESLWLGLDRATILFSVVAACFSVLAWLRSTKNFRTNRAAELKRRAAITIRLMCDGQTLELPYKPRRDRLSRQELTGLLSFYYGEKRFEPAIVRRVLEDGSLSRVLAGDNEHSSEDEILEIRVDSDFFEKVRAGLQISLAG